MGVCNSVCHSGPSPAELEAEERRLSEERAAREKRAAEEKAAREKKAAEEKAAEEQRRRDAVPSISVTVRLKESEDSTITVKPWQRVFESVVKGLDPNHLWIVDEVRYGETKLATSTTWEAEGNSSLRGARGMGCLKREEHGRHVHERLLL